MAVLERVREAGILGWRARKEARGPMQSSTEAPKPVLSETFLHNLEEQRALDARLAGLVPTGPSRHIGFGQDRDVSLVPTDLGDFVVKKLKESSRPWMVFGLGIPAGIIPLDTDTTGARQSLVDVHRHVTVDPETVAEKLRLTHVLATTYLDRGEGLLVPTATVVENGVVQDRQRYLPQLGPVGLVERDPREIAIETQAKAGLFRTLQERWRAMLDTPDFRGMPNDVQDYWRTFPPDSGYGTNARFLGIGHVKAFDY